MAQPSTRYEPRRPEHSTLYQIVLEHFETFRAQAASLRDGEGLPRFVEQEFRDFLRCGCLAGGFARFRCDGCGLDRLVPFSCKRRGFCSSCGGRRMAERAAHLVDHVFPDMAVRQWVLSLPHRLRYLLAWDHDLCRAVGILAPRAAWRCHVVEGIRSDDRSEPVTAGSPRPDGNRPRRPGALLWADLMRRTFVPDVCWDDEVATVDDCS